MERIVVDLGGGSFGELIENTLQLEDNFEIKMIIFGKPALLALRDALNNLYPVEGK